jgi:hypothetical protein
LRLMIVAGELPTNHSLDCRGWPILVVGGIFFVGGSKGAGGRHERQHTSGCNCMDCKAQVVRLGAANEPTGKEASDPSAGEYG